MGVCQVTDPASPFYPPEASHPRLRLAHTVGSTIEILERVGVNDFLRCTGVSALRSASVMGSRSWRTVFSSVVDDMIGLLRPAELYAAHGGLGGKVRSFSPFGAVDVTVNEVPVTTPPLRSLWVAGGAAPDVFAVGEAGTILHYDGAVWRPETSGTTSTLYGIAKYDTTLFVVGAGGTILASTGNGAWTRQTSGTTSDLYSVGGEKGVFLAVGTIIRSSDGINWGIVPSGTTRNLHSGVANNVDLFLVGDGGTVLHSSNGALTWTAIPFPATIDLFAIVGNGLSDLTVAGGGGPTGGSVYRYNGSVWTKIL